MDAQGAIDSLLGRLTTVLVSEAQLLGGLRGDVEFISDEMESMNGLLLHLAESHNRDNQVRAWMKQVAGLSRDCEGNVELYVQYVGGAGPGARKGVLGSLLRMLRFVRTMSARHRIATRIRELKVRARDVGDRRERYGVTVPSAPSRTIADAPAPQPGGDEYEEDLRRRELLYGEPPDTIEEDSNKVAKCVISVYTDDKKRLFCIEGVGKTAIARKVFNHPSVVRKIRHRVWVNNGGLNREYHEVRKEILEQLQHKIKSLRDIGKHSRISDCMSYGDVLIVIDGVNDQPKDYSSLYCSELEAFTYNAAPLSVHLSAGLYSDFGRNGVFLMTGHHFYNDHIRTGYYAKKFRFETRPNFFRNRALGLAKCEGSAVLAVLTKCYHGTLAAHLFLCLLYVNPHRATAELETLCRVLEENRNNTDKTMLMVCYNELPSHHKSCLMYLSIFPQGHIIMRADLLRRWVCEGLITKRSAGTSTLHDQAERIFDSLVTRGFICPGETSSAGKIKSFTLHHVVHDFIVTDVGFVDTSSRPELAHRFSINGGVAIQEESLSESDPSDHGILTTIESLAKSDQWQFLKVLDLRGCKGLTEKHLNSICKILLLKYLSLRNTNVAELPKDIEKLQCLQTLDIRQTAVRVLATKSVVLPMLKHLLAGKIDSPTPNNDSDIDKFEESFVTMRLPRSIRRMEKIEVLSHVEVARSDDLTDVGKLLRLRKLGVILQGKKEELELLFQQIEKLHGCLCSLSIQIGQLTKSEDALPLPPEHLRSLNISGITGGLHLWIAGHDQLTKITLSKTGLGEEALSILGQLRILRCLRLRSKSYVESQLKFKEGEFKSLKSLVVEGSNITSIAFEVGAAPKLELIVWSFVSMKILSGLDHLPKLKKVELKGDICDIDSVKEEIKEHPNHPELKYNGQLHCKPESAASTP